MSLVYYAIGPADGEPWLVLHGLGSIAASWSPVMRRLRRSCRLLVPELSALGGTRCDGDGLGIPAAVEVLTGAARPRGGRAAGHRAGPQPGRLDGGAAGPRPPRAGRPPGAGRHRRLPPSGLGADPVAGRGARPRRGRPPLRGPVRRGPLGDGDLPGHLPQGLHLAGGAHRARRAHRGRHLRRRRPRHPADAGGGDLGGTGRPVHRRDRPGDRRRPPPRPPGDRPALRPRHPPGAPGRSERGAAALPRRHGGLESRQSRGGKPWPAPST